MKLLIIEDNPRLAERIKDKLKKWFIIELAPTAHEALTLATAHTFDAILLDLGLPDLSGLDLCKKLRDILPDIPILVVTGNDETLQKVALLDAGADDYLTKPFDAKELRARVDALLRRRSRLPLARTLSAGDLTLDPSRRTAQRAGIALTLRKKEFDILEYLVLHQGRVLTREMIIRHAWSSTNPGWVGSVDVHVKHLRDKIDRPFPQPLIRTVYAVGYILDPPKHPTPVDIPHTTQKEGESDDK